MTTDLMERKKAPTEVIDKIVHQRIIADMDRVCETANVPAKFVRQSMAYYCTDSDVEWVRKFNINRKKGNVGYMIEGENQHTETRCMSLTGTLVRHFIDARIFSLNSVIADPQAAGDPTVLVIPNFYMTSYGKQLTAWQMQTVYDVLLSRLVASKPTIIGVQNFNDMAQAYGTVFAEHISENFIKAY